MQPSVKSKGPADAFGRPLLNLRISVTDRCNLRCRYCMPEEEYGWLTAWLTNHCRNVLLQWRAMLGSDFSRYVFPSTRISGMHITDYKSAWRRAAEEAGLKDRRIYDL